MPNNRKEAQAALYEILDVNTFGEAGERIIIEPKLRGWEVSYIVLTDGKTIVPLMPGQDYKPIGDGNQGTNTGGMGGVFPLDDLTEAMKRGIESRIIHQTLDAMRSMGRPYKGTLYAGIMMTKDGEKLLEFNVRFGDPETQPQVFMMKSELLPYLMACTEGNLSELPPIEWKPGYCVGVVMASDGYPGKYETGKLITLDDTSDLAFDHMTFHAGTKIADDKNIYTSGGRVLLNVAHGSTLDEAIRNAYTLNSRRHFENAYFRKDIGTIYRN